MKKNPNSTPTRRFMSYTLYKLSRTSHSHTANNELALRGTRVACDLRNANPRIGLPAYALRFCWNTGPGRGTDEKFLNRFAGCFILRLEMLREEKGRGKISLEADGASARRPANRDDLEEVAGERGCYGSSYAARKRHNGRKCCRRKINELRRRTLAWRVHILKTENSVARSRICRVKIRWARRYNFNDSRALKNLLFNFMN